MPTPYEQSRDKRYAIIKECLKEGLSEIDIVTRLNDGVKPGRTAIGGQISALRKSIKAIEKTKS